MKIKKVAYTKTYPIGLCWEKIFVEMELSEEDDARKALYEAKKTVENFHYESNKAAEKELAEKSATQQEQKPKTRSEEMVEAIESVKELKVLEIYKPLAKKYPEIQDAYDKKLKELSI